MRLSIAMKPILPALFVFCQFLIGSSVANPLLDAARANNKMQVDQLLESGAHIHARGPQGDTALHWAAYHGDASMARRLIAAGARVDATVNNGSTPLHLAAYNGHTAAVETLIAHGATVNPRTEAGVTPLDWAERNGHPEVAELLRAKGGTSGAKAPDEDTLAAYKEIRPARPEDLRQLNRIMAKYRLSKTSRRSPPSEDVKKEEAPHPVSPAPGRAFRIQLAAFGSEQRAVLTWERYREQHPEILGGRELILDAIRSKGKSYYRVQTGALSGNDARSLCARLKRRNQPCIVVKADPHPSGVDR